MFKYLTARAFPLSGSINNNGGSSNGDEENYKALQVLHAELDDDHDGQVNILESNDVYSLFFSSTFFSSILCLVSLLWETNFFYSL